MQPGGGNDGRSILNLELILTTCCPTTSDIKIVHRCSKHTKMCVKNDKREVQTLAPLSVGPRNWFPVFWLVYNTQQPPILILDHFFQFDC